MSASTKADRLANTVLYLLRERPGAGLTKLLKLIFHVDYHHYRDHLKTVTGVEYVALERGPVMNDYKELLSSLERRGVVSTREVPVLGQNPKSEYLALMEPNMDSFSDDELQTMREVVLKYGDLSGAALSRLTHEEALPWTLVWDGQPGKTIPVEMFRWTDNMASERNVEESRRRALRPEIAEELAELRASS